MDMYQKNTNSKTVLLSNGGCMSEIALTRLSSKGQIVVPKGVRELMHLEEGEVFVVFGEDDTIILKRMDLPSKAEFKRLLKWGEEFAKKKGITQEEVMQAIYDSRAK